MGYNLYKITDALVAAGHSEVTAIPNTGKDTRESSTNIEVLRNLAIIAPTSRTEGTTSSISRIGGFGIQPTAESQVLKHGLQIKDASATNAAHELGAVNANKDANKESRSI